MLSSKNLLKNKIKYLKKFTTKKSNISLWSQLELKQEEFFFINKFKEMKFKAPIIREIPKSKIKMRKNKFQKQILI